MCGGKSAGSVVEVIYFVKRSSGVEGWGCWLWVRDVQWWWLCFRASRRCCTEALSDVSINPSPILLGKLLGITVYSCIYYIFSDLGICLAYCGRLEHSNSVQAVPVPEAARSTNIGQRRADRCLQSMHTTFSASVATLNDVNSTAAKSCCLQSMQWAACSSENPSQQG